MLTDGFSIEVDFAVGEYGIKTKFDQAVFPVFGDFKLMQVGGCLLFGQVVPLVASLAGDLDVRPGVA